MDEQGKLLKDLVGWKHSLNMNSFFGRPYGFYISPDGTQLASVDLSDDEVASIWDRNLKKIVYIHPVTRRGMDRAGVTPKQLDEMMKRWFDDHADQIWGKRK